MHRYSTKLIFIFVVTSFLFVGCASGPQEQTGFLSDYSKLKKNPNFDGSSIYINPKLPLKNYSKFIISPVQVRLSKEGKDNDVDPSKLTELAKYTRKALATELSKSGYEIVRDSGPNTMVIRVALTDVKPAKIAMNIHPGMILTGVGLGGASAEAEMTDSLTGKVVVAALESQKGERGFAGLTKYGNAENVIDRWAKRLAIRMDKEHGKTRN